MRKLLTVTAIGIGLACGATQALAQAQKMAPTLDKAGAMSACEKAAGMRKGEDRKSFLMSCVAARVEPQQSRMSNASTKSSSDCGHGGASDL